MVKEIKFTTFKSNMNWVVGKVGSAAGLLFIFSIDKITINNLMTSFKSSLGVHKDLL